MNLPTIAASLIILIGGGAYNSASAAQSDSPESASYEFKVILKNSHFTSNHRDTGIENFISIISAQPKVSVSKDTKEKSRIVSYLDTKKCDLINNNYILRKRFTLKNDIPDRLKITLKYRGFALDDVGGRSFQANPNPDSTKSKYETDIVRDQSSKIQQKPSYSASIELGKIKKMSDLLSLYPELTELNLDDKTKLKTVRNFAAFETVVEFNTVTIAGQKCEASFSFWYEDRKKTHPIVSEFSYVCDKLTDEGQELYRAILEQGDWVSVDSSTKTAVAYGNFCNNQ